MDTPNLDNQSKSDDDGKYFWEDPLSWIKEHMTVAGAEALKVTAISRVAASATNPVYVI